MGDLVLRHERVARGGAAAAAPGGDRAVGGRGRPLPRRRPPRRHLLERLLSRLGRSRAQPSDRRRRGRSRAAPARDATASCTRATIRTWPTCACRCCRPATGAAPACTCAATSRAISARARRTSTCRSTSATTSIRSTRSKAASCSCASSSSSCAASTPASPASRRSASRSATTPTATVWRYENEWPLARTQWTEQHLDASARGLATTRPRRRARSATTPTRRRDSRTPLRHGAVRARHGGHRADQAAAVGLVDQRRRGSLRDRAQARPRRPRGARTRDRASAAARSRSPTAGCASRTASSIRCARRRAVRSTRHDELQKLQPGEIVPVEIEIWPTSVVFERGERLVLEVGAKDDPHSSVPARRPARSGSHRNEHDPHGRRRSTHTCCCRSFPSAERELARKVGRVVGHRRFDHPVGVGRVVDGLDRDLRRLSGRRACTS